MFEIAVLKVSFPSPQVEVQAAEGKYLWRAGCSFCCKFDSSIALYRRHGMKVEPHG